MAQVRELHQSGVPGIHLFTMNGLGATKRVVSGLQEGTASAPCGVGEESVVRRSKALISAAGLAVVALVAAPALAAAPMGPAPAVLPSTESAASGIPQGIAPVLDPLLQDPSLGGSVGAVVIDVVSGQIVYQREAATPRSLASNDKILTALAVLNLGGPETRIETTVVAGAGSVTIVGAGAPTLATVSADGSSLTELADQTAAVTEGAVAVHYDTSLFAGSQTAPGWDGDYPALGVAAPVSSLTVDRSRVPDSDSRVDDPAYVAAQRFADLLSERGVTVTEVTPSSASGEVIASTRSVPVATMIETMLTESDNDSAEILAHLAGAQLTGVGTFESGAQATMETLQSLGLPISGTVIVDGSGLSYANVTSPNLLASAVSLAAGQAAPSWTWPLLLGLPVAGLTGTLADRFVGAETAAAAGFVRAKTGTLIEVSTLSGTVVDRDGRLLAFAFMSDATTDIPDSRVALDRAAAALAACGCLN